MDLCKGVYTERICSARTSYKKHFFRRRDLHNLDLCLTSLIPVTIQNNERHTGVHHDLFRDIDGDHEIYRDAQLRIVRSFTRSNGLWPL